MKHVRLPLVVSILVACLTAGCVPPRASEREVEARIAGFLSAVRDGADGYGWDHLRDDVRAGYPGGRGAWVRAIETTEPSRLTWQVTDVVVDDYVGCARVDFAESLQHVPATLFDEYLPAMARVANRIADGAFTICAKVGPFPWDVGVQGVG